jgi:RNA polymerase sigma-70 factor (ECF subfamily)
MILTAAAMAMEGTEAVRGTIAAARAGDLAAFELLMRRHERLVLTTALRLTGNLEDAKDISQEVFLKLYRNLAKVEAPGALPGWLYRVTVNACHDLRRRHPVSAPVEMAEELAATGNDPQASAAEAERRRVLELSLRLLPEKERAALVLRDLEGLSTEEVARALGSSEATVRSQVSKARGKVHDFVERYFAPRKGKSG